ncbi:MAG: N-acetylmannosamine-6-phosphate 2-epimerase [Mycoplasmatales bacterium]|nr:N-acetylmannosamine-6-phosphate 2-epimerase [Mycoplasmatales bacterium]
MKFKNKMFIVSCQALEDEPLYGEGIMLKMAKAALIGGADAIRTSQINNIKDIMTLGVPVIGLIKRVYENSNVYITPTIKEVQELIDTGVHIIAIDATLRERPKESLEKVATYAKKYKKDHQLLMADCSNKEDVENAIQLGFDIVGTTMRGYTEETKGRSNIENDYEFLAWCVERTKATNVKVIAEGGLNTPHDAKKVFEKNVDALVVGSAITRPRTIVERFIKEFK